MENYWVIQEKGKQDIVTKLTDELNIHPVLANLLVQRGVKNFNQAKAFFRPSLNHLYDPFLMKNMAKAIERTTKAVKSGEKILIYGDYDVDGTTAVAMVYSFFRKQYSDLFFYIPDRYNEGYGISYEGIEYAREHDVTLIITLDCGIKANEKIAFAKQYNIDFIVCDHHTPGDELPEAVAILDPKQSDCNYPYKELSGCGVGFKFIHAYCIRNKISFDEILEYLDLVAVSTASDIVPITDENRVLAYYGLEQLCRAPRIGLRAIKEVAGMESIPMKISDIVFKIGPRINAAGRIEKGKEAVDLLLSQNYDQAKLLSEKIDENNATRKKLDEQITKEALEMIEADESLKYSKTSVLYSSNWHKGVIGIVASRLIETYYRPTVILTKSNEKATGSARSVEGFNLYEALEACSDLFVNFGGHKYAAGITLEIENIPAFKEKFEQIVSESISPEMLVPKIHIDSELELKDITPKFYRILRQFAPFGPENMTPIFVTKNVKDTGGCRIVGSTGEHLRLEVRDNYFNVITGIAFFQADHLENIKSGKPFHICYSIEENEFNGRVSLQLQVRDIKFNDDLEN